MPILPYKLENYRQGDQLSQRLILVTNHDSVSSASAFKSSSQSWLN